MTPDKISKHVASDRLNWVARMMNEIRVLPLSDKQAFFADSRNLWSAESCLRRALEALFDLGRHILAKGFGRGVSEYKEIASTLKECGVLSEEDARLFAILAGFRNRLVHFYHEISADELYLICTTDLHDIEHIAEAFRIWLRGNPQRIDQTL